MKNVLSEKVNEDNELSLLRKAIDEGVKSGRAKNFDADKFLLKLKKHKKNS